MEEKNLIAEARNLVGRTNIAAACWVTHVAVLKWERAGRLPRTELTGETQYAGRIAKLTKNRITKRSLLRWTARKWAANKKDKQKKAA